MQKRLLFLDDDEGFLTAVKQLFTAMSQGSWTIFTAQNHAQALEILQNERVEVVVLDIGMPVMDGFQFLRLLHRTHPGQQSVMLTGQATPEHKKMCLEGGAALLLEKPVKSEGYEEIFAALDALASAHPQTGFRGTMRQVGLQEVLQMECLGRKSSVLKIFTGKVRGRIFVCDGSIVHAESGAIQGEAALYGMLALRGGEFNLLPFAEPERRSIVGHWEFLLMEAARLTDEGTTFVDLEEAAARETQVALAAAENSAAYAATEFAPAKTEPLAPMDTETMLAGERRVAETLLCSGAGEVLYESGCEAAKRMELLGQIEEQASQLSALAPAGRFDRLEILAEEGRIVCQVQPDRRLFVRSIPNSAEAA
jgi:CheY-like chemotaxis protein